MRRLQNHQYLHVAAGRLFRAYDYLVPHAHSDEYENMEEALVWVDHAIQHLSSVRQSLKAKITNSKKSMAVK